MLWSALQATQLIDIDMEVATGLKAVQDIFLTASETSDRDSEANKDVSKESVEEKVECTTSEEVN